MPERDGATYDGSLDRERLSRQHRLVWGYMARPGMDCWHTLAEISRATGCPEASVSARLRDFRKPRWGSNFVNRQHRGDPKDGLYEYQLVVRVRRPPEQPSLFGGGPSGAEAR